MRRRTAALHTLVGAYVMDAVPESDRTAFERHLSGCPACLDEVRGMREATARLAEAAAIEPRAELRDQTLRAATRLRQVPPLVDADEAGLAGLTRRLPQRRSRSSRSARPLRSGWLSVTTAAAIAVAVLFAGAAIGLGLHLSSMQHRLSVADQRDHAIMQHRLSVADRRDHAIAAVLGAKDAVTMTASVRTGGTATVVMSHQAKSLVFIASKLSALPASRSYELWIMSPSGDKPVGMLPPAHGGMFGPMVVGGLQAGDQVGLTVEPAAGSRLPSSTPIVLVGLGA
jgi:anti-sigma factor RsiW